MSNKATERRKNEERDDDDPDAAFEEAIKQAAEPRKNEERDDDDPFVAFEKAYKELLIRQLRLEQREAARALVEANNELRNFQRRLEEGELDGLLQSRLAERKLISLLQNSLKDDLPF
jgi:hypothetical protein